MHSLSKIKSITASLHQRNGPFAFCFHGRTWKWLKGPTTERITATLCLSACWKTDPAYSTYTSHPHQPLPLLPCCSPVWACPPPPLLPPLLLPLHRGGIYILIGRAAHRLRMRVCVQANSRKRTQLHKFPMNPPDDSWAGENDIFSHWASPSAAYGSRYINVCT